MSWKEQDRLAEDSTAEIYDYLYNHTHFAHSMYNDFAEAIARRVQSGRVLELACGTGTVSQLVKKKAPNVITYGIDHSPKMIEIARTRIDNCMIGDIEDLPFEDGYFDAVYIHSALHHFPDLAQIMNEARRVLKDGHFFFIQEPNKHRIQATNGVRILRWLAGHFVKKYPDVSHLEVRPSEVHDTITMDQVVEPLKNAGFEILEKQYRYNASWLLSIFDSMTVHKLGRMLDNAKTDGYMFQVIARK